jgi:PAS domain S-box-containing protein
MKENILLPNNVNDMGFLVGNGEMHQLIKEKDWSSTSLGSPALWPQSLKITLNIVLNNQFPMFLFWGKELICFYNDAYRMSLGNEGKHPQILGTPGAIAWKEIWDYLNPLFNQVLTNDEAIWRKDQLIPIFRNGRTEDVYWTFSYSPVQDDNGQTSGVLVTCTETTQQVYTLDNLKEINRKFRTNLLQAPVAMCVFRGEDFHVELANELMLQLWNKNQEEVINYSFFEVVPEARSLGLYELMNRAYTSGEKVVVNEQPVNLIFDGKEQKKYLNLMFQPIIESDNIIDGIITTAIDVTEQVKARANIEENERRISRIVNFSPFPMAFFTGPDLRIDMANKSMINFWKKGRDVIGQNLEDVLPEFVDQGIVEEMKSAFRSGNSIDIENKPTEIFADGSLHLSYLNYSITPFKNLEGKSYGLLVTSADVTELQLSKNKLEESEKQFRKIADSAPVLIWMCDTVKTSSFFNVAWLNFTGRTMEQETGFGWLDGVHPEDKEQCINIFEAAFKKQEKFYMEYRLRRYDGAYRWVSDNAVPRYTPEGTFEGFIGACHDIHEKVTYQQKLKEDDDKLNVVIDSSELGIVEVNMVDNTINSSSRFKEIIGFPSDYQHTYEEVIEKIIPQDRIKRTNAIEKAKVDGKTHFTARIQYSQDEIRWVEARGRITYDENSKPIRLLGTFRDMTLEKQRQQEIEESERKFRTLADSINQLIWTADSNGNLNYFNRYSYRYSKIASELLFEKGWELLIHPDDKDISYQYWKDSLISGNDFLCEHRLRRHDGQFRWHICRAIPQKDKEGTIQMWVCTSTDIHDQKINVNKLENKVRERTEELEKKNFELDRMNKELQAFAYISSHDLQEPLRKIQTFSSIILDKEFENLSVTGKNNFNRMKSAAERMQTLIKDLLTYSRTNTEEKLYEPTDLNHILEDVKEELADDMITNQVELKVHNLCIINIIPFQFRQLFNNLISNSIKFTKKGQPPVIEIFSEVALGKEFNFESLDPNVEYCCIRISDQGIGFDPQYNTRIFEVFQRLHTRTNYKGTGIGLAIVKKIIENHNGFIFAEGKENEGTTFTMFVPTDPSLA